MKAIAISLSSVSLVLGALPLFRHTRRATLFLLIPKYLAASVAPYVALAGVFGAAIGLVYGSAAAVVTGAVGAALAADYVRRVSARHDGFERAFGANWKLLVPPESEERLARRRWGWSVPSAPEPRWTRDLAFWTIPGTDRKLLCDLWQPPAGVEPSGTAIVYLHGGAWYLLDKDVLTRPFFRQLAAQGHVVMDVAYRSCPEVDVTGMVADAKRAIAWMKEHAAEFGVRPDSVVLMGASAGGHVALLTAYSPKHPLLTVEDLGNADTSVLAVVSYYGVADLRAYGNHTTARLADVEREPTSIVRRQPGRLESALMRLTLGRALTAEQSPPTPPHRQMMLDLVGGPPDKVPDRYDLASPIHHVSASCPATLLFQGAHDSIVPVASTRRLHQALVAVGVRTVYVEFPRTEHAFDLPLLAPAAQAALYDLERFLVCVAGEARGARQQDRTQQEAKASPGEPGTSGARREGRVQWA